MRWQHFCDPRGPVKQRSWGRTKAVAGWLCRCMKPRTPGGSSHMRVQNRSLTSPPAGGGDSLAERTSRLVHGTIN